MTRSGSCMVPEMLVPYEVEKPGVFGSGGLEGDEVAASGLATGGSGSGRAEVDGAAAGGLEAGGAVAGGLASGGAAAGGPAAGGIEAGGPATGELAIGGLEAWGLADSMKCKFTTAE